jgi:hypothetical protein
MSATRPHYLVWIKGKIESTRRKDVVNLATSGVTTVLAKQWQDQVMTKRAVEIVQRSAEPNEFGLPSLKERGKNNFGVWLV